VSGASGVLTAQVEGGEARGAEAEGRVDGLVGPALQHGRALVAVAAALAAAVAAGVRVAVDEERGARVQRPAAALQRGGAARRHWTRAAHSLAHPLLRGRPALAAHFLVVLG